MKGSEGAMKEIFSGTSNLISSVFSILTIMLSSNGEMASLPLIRSRPFSVKLGRRPTAAKAPTCNS